jgi:hypothetical protein
MNARPKSELLIGAFLLAILLAVSASVAFPVARSGIDALSGDYLAEGRSSLFLLLAATVGSLAFTDFAATIRRSEYLRSQALLLTCTAFFAYLVFRYLHLIRRAPELAEIVVVAAMGIMVLISFVLAVRFMLGGGFWGAR